MMEKRKKRGRKIMNRRIMVLLMIMNDLRVFENNYFFIFLFFMNIRNFAAALKLQSSLFQSSLFHPSIL